MNRIRAIAVVLSMVLFLVGAAGNTEEKTSQAEASYEGKDVESTLQPPDQSRAAEEVSWELPEESPQETNTEPDQNIQPDEVLPVEVQPEEEIKQEEPQRIIDVTEEDYTALLKIVEAEASGEDVKGKMLVANVVINRLHHGAFGSTIKDVVYQRVNGKAQFSPVATGKIEKVVISEETIEAVERVLCGEDESRGALYFAARAYADPKNMAWFDENLTWLFQYHGHEFYS